MTWVVDLKKLLIFGEVAVCVCFFPSSFFDENSLSSLRLYKLF